METGSGVLNNDSRPRFRPNDRLLREQKDVAGTTIGDETIFNEYGSSSNPSTVLTGKFTYDAIEETRPMAMDPMGSTTFEYDLRGRMKTSVVDSDGNGDPESNSTYTYNADGIRSSQTVNGVTTHYLVDDNNPTGYAQVLEEKRDLNDDDIIQDDEVTKSYVIGHDVLAQAAAAQAIFLVYDGHGSTRALLDHVAQIVQNAAAGNQQQLFAYDAYGNLLVAQGLVQQVAQALTSLLYSGEQTDAATGLQYLRARYYSSLTGTFNRVDPFAGNLQDPQSLHKYLYTHGDPVNRIDPSGEFWLPFIFSPIGLFIGALALFYFRNSSAYFTPPNAFIPVDYDKLETNYQSVRISNSRLSADELFDAMTKLSSLNLSPVRASRDVRPNGVIGFDMDGFIDFFELGQGDFFVRATKFDRADRFFAVRTLGGHPLAGWRGWRIKRLNGGDVLVETFAVEHPATIVDDNIKFNLGAASGMEQTWISMFDSLVDRSGGTIVWGRDTNFHAVQREVQPYLRQVE